MLHLRHFKQNNSHFPGSLQSPQQSLLPCIKWVKQARQGMSMMYFQDLPHHNNKRSSTPHCTHWRISVSKHLNLVISFSCATCVVFPIQSFVDVDVLLHCGSPEYAAILVLLKSMTISLVLVMFKCRWFFLPASHAGWRAVSGWRTAGLHTQDDVRTRKPAWLDSVQLSL